MKRATLAALLVLALSPGLARAAAKAAKEPAGSKAEEPKAAKTEGEQPAAAAEPEGAGAEVATPDGKKKEGKGVEQVFETYTVKPGDNLWDLSTKFLGNPWYWPKVWSYNPEIENPHWIYPGNTIRFYPGGEEMPAQVDTGPAPASPEELDDVTKGTLVNTPSDFGEDQEDVVAITSGTKIGFHTGSKQSQLRQDGLITKRELDDAGVIEKSFSEHELLDTYERVYVRFKNKSAVRLGERYSIFRTIGAVEHPITGADYGYMTHIVGTIRVIAVEKELVTGMIEHSIDDINRGDFVGPLGNFEKQVIIKENTRQVRGVILVALVPDFGLLGEQHWVFIDKGSRDGVEEGNIFTAIHRGDPLLGESSKVFPEENAGTLLVVDVKEHTSSALVIRSVVELDVGDLVVMKTAGQASAKP
jgi:hypothetical protein